MRTKFTLFLVFINVALFYTIFYLRTEQTQVSPDLNLILGPESSNLNAITIEAADGAAVRLAQREAQWVLTDPLRWNANEFAVRFIMNELNSLRSETFFPVTDLKASGQTLADYGLEKPRIRLTLTPAGGAPLTLQVGDATQGGNRLYLLSADAKRIHVVNRSLAERLGMGLGELRSESIFTIPVFEAQALTVETGSGQRTLLRRDGPRWNIETLRALANRVDTELALGALTGLKVAQFTDKAIASTLTAAFAAPEMRITVEGNGRRQTLLIGAPAPEVPDAPLPEQHSLYFAQMEGEPNREGTVFTLAVPKELLNTLRRAQRDLREKRILNLEVSRVSAISIQSPESEVSLQRLEDAAPGELGTNWQVVTRRGDQSLASAPAEPKAVAQLLADLSRLAAEEFTNDAPSQAERESYGFVRPLRRVTLSLRPSESGPAPAPVTLLIGNGVDHLTYAGLANQEPVYRVSSEILTQCGTTALAYQDRTIREVPAAGQLTHLRLEALDGARVLAETDLPAAEAAAPVTALINQLRRVHAEELLGNFTPTGPVLDGLERAWSHRLEVSFTLGGANTEKASYTLYLAPRTGGTTWVAGAPTNNVNFKLEPALAEALFTLIFGDQDPGVPPPEPSKG